MIFVIIVFVAMIATLVLEMIGKKNHRKKWINGLHHLGGNGELFIAKLCDDPLNREFSVRKGEKGLLYFNVDNEYYFPREVYIKRKKENG